jgi:membrane protein required for beta-lactamase induction
LGPISVRQWQILASGPFAECREPADLPFSKAPRFQTYRALNDLNTSGPAVFLDLLGRTFVRSTNLGFALVGAEDKALKQVTDSLQSDEHRHGTDTNSVKGSNESPSNIGDCNIKS